MTVAQDLYTIELGLLYCAAGLLTGTFLFFMVKSGIIVIFTITLGALTGFMLANSLDICFFYKVDIFDNFDRPTLFLYAPCLLMCILFGHIFNFNIYGYYLSWCGAFLITRGSIMISIND